MSEEKHLVTKKKGRVAVFYVNLEPEKTDLERNSDNRDNEILAVLDIANCKLDSQI